MKPRLRPNTVLSYEQNVRVHIKPGLGKFTLAKLKPEDVQCFINKKLEEGFAPKTVAYLRALLCTALDQALRWGLISRNVATLVDSPSVPRYAGRPLDATEAATFLAAIRGTAHEALFVVPLSMGLRKGEVLALRWENIDFESRNLRVENTLYRLKGALQIGETKTERSRRALIMPEVGIAALREHRKRQNEARLRAGGAWVDGGFVFTNAIGGPLDPAWALEKLKAVFKAAGLRDIRFHDLRHSFATFLASQNIHPRVAMEMMGHSEIRTTLEIYSHVGSTLLEEGSAAIDKVLQKTS